MSHSSESHGTHDLNVPAMTTNLSGLIERLRAAAEGSRELDGLITAVTEGRDIVEGVYGPTGAFCWLARNKNLPHDAYVVWVKDSAPDLNVKPFTTDLSAIVALVEKKLPGWSWIAEGGSKRCSGVILSPEVEDGEGAFTGNAKTAPLALCTALLLALQSEVSNV